MRYMYDCTHAEVPNLAAINPSFVAMYLTGSSSIRWTSSDVQQFSSGTEFVRIDQGGPGSPQYEADVFDAEPGAWSISGAIAATKKCTADRPTIYCDRSDYATIPDSYTDDIWLAAPGLTDAQAQALAATDSRIVAVQNYWGTEWDRSAVFDAYWPNIAGLPANWYYGPVQGLTLVNVGPSSFKISFSAPAENTGYPAAVPPHKPAISNYQVSVTAGTTLSGANLPSYPRYIDKGDNPQVWQGGSVNGTCTAGVRALNNGGHAGPWQTVTFTTT